RFKQEFRHEGCCQFDCLWGRSSEGLCVARKREYESKSGLFEQLVTAVAVGRNGKADTLPRFDMVKLLGRVDGDQHDWPLFLDDWLGKPLDLGNYPRGPVADHAQIFVALRCAWHD